MSQQHIQSYIPAIDGYRAIAVVSVFLFHLFPEVLPGGFIGVDVFFVISGFLITRLILKELTAERFSLLTFYQRRIARIFPVFFAAIGATLVAAAVLYNDQDFANVAEAAGYTSVFLANIHLLTLGSYFGIEHDAQPLLHYWSLAVEEQFYLFFPLLLILVWGSRTWLLRSTIALLLLSLVLCIGVSLEKPRWAFYLLPTRAWQLLAGSLLAIYCDEIAAAARRHSNALAMLGLSLVVGSMVFLSGELSYPGVYAIAPTLGASLLIAACLQPSTGVVAGLSARPLRFVGKISYSLYIWHWPIFCIVDYRLMTWSAEPRVLIKVLLSLGLALLSYYLIETPARHYLNKPRSRNLALGGSVFAIVSSVVAAFQITSTHFVFARDSELRAEGRFYDNKSDHEVVLLGDSMATMYGAVFRRELRDLGLNFRLLASPATNFLPGESGTKWPQVVEILREHEPELIIISYAWRGKLHLNDNVLCDTLQQLEGLSSQILLLTDVPRLPDGVGRADVRDSKQYVFFEPSFSASRRTEALSILTSVTGQAVSLFDVSPYLLTEDGAIQFVGANGRATYHDTTHLSETGIETHKSELFSRVQYMVDAPSLPLSMPASCTDIRPVEGTLD
ncbi:acyltransferase family protein [Loktanella sp. 3ANDIMAR09]|uniref:acyltransferase family protein n=1 Tax=Loktanella sp. 3ANDIMAR09 TaxID=1225657 RepID=UPI0006FA1468|nr:acyltransferase family protein [Loktanella sp. 3ANDIMAR09]